MGISIVRYAGVVAGLAWACTGETGEWGAAGIGGVIAGDNTLDGGGLADAEVAVGPRFDPGRCPDGFPRGPATGESRRIARFTPSPEGVAVCPDGEVFLTRDGPGQGEVWRVSLDGQSPERWAVLADRRPAGIACDAQGRLFVAVFSSLSGDPIPITAVMISGPGETPIELPLPANGVPLGGLNGIVAVAGVGVYASDSLSGQLVLVEETGSGMTRSRVVASGIVLANGLAYHKASRTLYAVSSGAGQVLAYAVGGDGTLGEAAVVPLNGQILLPDGVAVDEAGSLYVADYLGGAVVNASSGAAVLRVDNPASLAFRGGTLLVTDYKLLDPEAEGGLYAVDLGVCSGAF